MRPHKLTIEGFTCFADLAEIDFRGLDVFVISGPTGAGKSTIIDAMCYALYGRIPRASETQQLISHNRDSMRVGLDFESGGAEYRVARTLNIVRKTGKDGREEKKRGPSPVQLERKRADGEWEPIEGRVANIDDEIERIVGLDFDAFQRCVVLPQGRSQEFLAGDSKVRRNILEELLELGVYKRIQQAANARAAKLTTEADTNERVLKRDYAGATDEALMVCRAELETTLPALAQARERRDAFGQARELAVGVRASRDQERDLLEQQVTKMREIEEAVRLGKEGAARVVELRASRTVADKERRAVAYDRELHQRLQIAQERWRNVLAAEETLMRMRGELADERAIASKRSAAEAARASCEEADTAVRDAVARREAAQLADAAAHVRSGVQAGDKCPVCGGVVGKIAKAQAGDIKAADKGVRDAEARASKAQTALKAAESALTSEEQRRAMAQQQAATIERDAAEIRASVVADLPKGVAAKTETIAAAVKTQAQASAQAEALDKRLDVLGRELSELEPKVASSESAIEALRAVAAQLGEQSKAAGAQADTMKAGLLAVAQQWKLDEIVALIEQKKDPRPALLALATEADEAADVLTARKTELEQQVALIERDIERAATLAAEIATARSSAAVSNELGRLLRADQFVAYVISAAMEVLAAAASEHLLTLYPRFAMTAQGQEFHVIDHWQADSVRPAKTLSGGEMFVASLALALALSERLPELRSAAAARLDSLFLDEGFGTLDPETLETVINALEGLRSEERMVGVITHVPELSQRIEQRIVVVPSREGSVVQVG